VEWTVELGLPCDACGDPSDRPDGECPICFGVGYLLVVMTLEEFRALALCGRSRQPRTRGA
jgi:hypothetical protein